MKTNLLLILGVSLLLGSCVAKNTLTKTDITDFRNSGDSIFYKNEYVAKFLNIEWEYYRGKKTMEISVEQINGGADFMTDKIVDYIRLKHPNAKAEVKIKR